MRQRLIKGVLPSVLTLAVILGAIGCGKKAAQVTAPAPAPADTAAQPAPNQSRPATQVSTQSAAAPNDPDLGEINRNLIRWIVGHKKRPANFEEFAATAGVPIPPPPAGKKYIIGANPPKVQIVDQ